MRKYPAGKGFSRAIVRQLKEYDKRSKEFNALVQQLARTSRDPKWKEFLKDQGLLKEIEQPKQSPPRQITMKDIEISEEDLLELIRSGKATIKFKKGGCL